MTTGLLISPAVGLGRLQLSFTSSLCNAPSSSSIDSYQTTNKRFFPARRSRKPRLLVMAAVEIPEGAVFLGFDSSTQSLKATALNASLQVIAAEAVQFDADLPRYETKDGVHRGPNASVTAPPGMWAEALELVLQRLKDKSFDFSKVRAVSGSGQQHGSVYWRRGFKKYLQNLDSSKTLVDQLQSAFAFARSPVWMDSSTAQQCREIEAAVGGPAELARMTGSRAYERFTASQIRRLFEKERYAYEDCERISLVSSFQASLLIGDYASIDYSDGAGMNLMDLHTRDWCPSCLEATSSGLREKLGALAPAHAVAGKLHAFFVQRYGFSPDCTVIQWSGDNPCSLAGLALEKPGDLAISLGTSDTVFGVVSDPNPGLEGHVFPNPVDPASYMTMLCYKNGSLARQNIRDECAEGSWGRFNELLESAPAGNDGALGFYYKDPEILPPLPPGFHRFKFTRSADPASVEAFDPATEVRAIVEGQFLAMRAHSERIGMPKPPARVVATGGASANPALLRVAASVFGCDVFTAKRPDSASVGAALRAAHGWLCSQAEQRGGLREARSSTFVPFSDLLRRGKGESAVKVDKAATCDNVLYEQYTKLVDIRNKLEAGLLGQVKQC